MKTKPIPYEVSGTRIEPGAIVEESFSEVIEAENARQAYLTIKRNGKYVSIRVIAIKIECPTCAGFHLTIPIEYYR